jgi:predicted MFS family arabinose efflux permease
LADAVVNAKPAVSRVVLALGITQTIAWGSSYYLLAVLADPMSQETGIGSNLIFAAFSVSLLLSGALGPRVGRTIDRIGGRAVLICSNLCFAAGLAILAASHSEAQIWAAWLFIGTGMGLGLYDAAFATLGVIYGTAARQPITGITLIAGFASTVSWPLTAASESYMGWRDTCLAWAAVHLLIGIPLNSTLPKGAGHIAHGAPDANPHIPMDRNMWLLAIAFAFGWTISTAMASQLPRLLEVCGAGKREAILAGMLIGPAQVAARLVEAGFLKRYHPLLSARLSASLHPIAAVLLILSPAAIPMFTILHGAGNGILTIARGTVPLAIYGPENYGYRLGILGAPSRMAQAAAPLVFGMLISSLGAGTLYVSLCLGLATLAAFCAINLAGNLAGKSSAAAPPAG